MVEYVHVWRVCGLNGMTVQGLSGTGVEQQKVFVGYWSLWTRGAFVLFMLCRFSWSEELESMLTILDATLLLPPPEVPRETSSIHPRETSPTSPRKTSSTPPREVCEHS